MNLRIQEKFSYVSCDFRDINGMLGYSITVYTQADECTTEYVDQWIEEFLNSFQIVLEQFSEKKLDDVKEGLMFGPDHDFTRRDLPAHLAFQAQHPACDPDGPTRI